MVAIEIILIIVIILLVIYLIIKTKPLKIEPDIKVFGDLMSKVGEIKTTIEERAKQQEKTDKQREEMMKKDKEMFTKEITNFTRMLSGTRERGAIGERILEETLLPFIKYRKVIRNLHVDNSIVEFGWKVSPSKFIPIDSKLPEVIELYKQYSNTDDKKEQQTIKKTIIRKVNKQISEVKKYRNKRNTTDKVILAVPDAIFELIPDVNSDFDKTGVFVIGYLLVAYAASFIEREYQFIVESGDIGEYKEIVSKLLSLLGDIRDKTSPIDRGVSMIQNANIGIKKFVMEGEVYKLRKPEKEIVKIKPKRKKEEEST